MLFNFFIFMLYAFIRITISSPTNDTDGDLDVSDLQLVLVLHRHGIRAPQATWPTDPYKNQALYWQVGWDELLPEGKMELFRLGKTLRERYRKFISQYSIKSVRVRSSDYDRCVMSSASLLAGWFPPANDQIWNPDLLWQPIPVHTIPVSLDWVLARGDQCPRYQSELNDAMNAYKATETDSDRWLYSYLSKYMNETIDGDNGPNKVAVYYSTMLIEDQVGYTLPDWTKAVYPAKMRAKTLNTTLVITSTPYLKKMLGGPMLQEILHKFNQKSVGENKYRKVLIYSAHDYTEAGTWIALGLPGAEIFPAFFGSALVFELHKSNDNNYFVKMFRYNDTTVTKPYEITIPHCGNPCPLPLFFNITNYVRSADPVEDCIMLN